MHPPPSPSLPFPYILTRHSQTPHNTKKSHIQTLTDKTQKYKKSSDYITFKFSTQFIDRQEINRQEVHSLRQCQGFHESKGEIGLVVVSPLSRCILTAREMGIEGVKIVVEPLVTSRVNSAWSVGTSLKEKILKYGEDKGVDFSECPQQEENGHWCIDLLMNDDESDFKEYYTLHNDPTKTHEAIILQYLKSGKSQSYTSIIKRALKFKQKLFTTYSQMCPPNKRILIISHSNYLKVLTAHKIDPKGKAKSEYLFDHINFIYVKEEALIRDSILEGKKKT